MSATGLSKSGSKNWFERSRVGGFPIAAALTVVLALSQAGCEPKYQGTELTSDDVDATQFHFSAADATFRSPVIITVPGRDLTAQDSPKRVRLERHWVYLHAPMWSILVSMGSGMCHIKLGGKISLCDSIEIRAPDATSTQEYVFYLGNWPGFEK